MVNIFVIIFIIIFGVIFVERKNWMDDFLFYGFLGVFIVVVFVFFVFVGFDVIVIVVEEFNNFIT